MWSAQQHDRTALLVQVASFELCGLDTVEQAVAAYRAVDAMPRRTWVGCKRVRTRHMTAFGRFRDGLYAELTRRTDDLADEVAALASLEEERGTMPVSKQFSQLQHLAAKHMKR